MEEPRRVVTRQTVQAAARQAGIELTDERADELLPQVQGILDTLGRLRQEVDLAGIEPASIFRPLEE